MNYTINDYVSSILLQDILIIIYQNMKIIIGACSITALRKVIEHALFALFIL